MISPKVPRPSKAQERAAYEAVTARDGGRCVRCGWYGTVHRDHRKNRSQGGLTVPSNLQLACVECHKWITENPSEATRTGFACPGWARPEFWPAWRHDVQSWVIYFDAPDSRGRWWDEITESVATVLMNGGHE